MKGQGYILFIVAALSICVHVKAGWRSIEPRQTDRTLTNAFFLNPRLGWVVGDSGTVLRTTDGGESWRFSEGATEKRLLDVVFSDSLHGWASGLSGTLIQTTDAGVTWNLHLKRTHYRLTDVYVSGNDTTWATSSNALLLRSFDGGHIWETISPIEYSDNYESFFLSSQIGWLYRWSDEVYYTSDAGATLSTRYVDSARASIRLMYFYDEHHGWAASTGNSPRLYATHDAGKSWQEGVVDTQDIEERYWAAGDFVFLDEQNGYFIPDESDPAVLLRTVDGGGRWSVDTTLTDPPENVYDLATDGAGNLWLVGQFGAIYTNKPVPGNVVASPRDRLIAASSMPNTRVIMKLGGRDRLLPGNGTLFDLRGRQCFGKTRDVPAPVRGVVIWKPER